MHVAGWSVIAPYSVPRRVKIAAQTWREIIKIVEERYPIEACGALFGSIHREVAKVTAVEELENILSSPKAFWFDVKDWMNAIIKHKNAGREYLGLFHSHGREQPLLSLSDRQRMLECPGEIWIIVAYRPSAEPKAAAWIIKGYGQGLAQLPVEIEYT